MAAGSIAIATPRALAADAGKRFDWLVVGATAWLLGGLYADGWAHGYNLPDSFWTVWHLIFYSGFSVFAAVVLGATALRRASAPTWRSAVPQGYLGSVIGAATFAVGGIADTAWHTAFGVEVGNDILLSPSHLLLALGIFLLVSGPVLADLSRRDQSTRLVDRLPMVLALTGVFSLLTFMTLYAGPYSGLLGAKGSSLRNDTVFRGLLGMFLFSAFVSGVLLFAIRRTNLPFGSVTILLGVNGLAMIVMQGHAPLETQLTIIAAAIGAGLIGDVLLRALRPSATRVVPMRVFAAAVPATFFVLYFTAIFVLAGWGWTFTFVSGSVVLCGLVGLLLSFTGTPLGPRATMDDA